MTIQVENIEEFPPLLLTGMITHRLLISITDREDPDQEPDIVGVPGEVIFRANVDYVTTIDGEGRPVTLGKGPIRAVYNDEGYLCTANSITSLPMYEGVNLHAGDDPNASVQDYSWTASFNLKSVNGTLLKIPPATFQVPAGSEQDLSTIIKIPSTPGWGLPQSELAARRAEAAAVRAEELLEEAAETFESALVTVNSSAQDSATSSAESTAAANRAEEHAANMVAANDAAMTEVAADPLSDFTIQLNNTIALETDPIAARIPAPTAALQDVIGKIRTAANDVSLLFISDSTAAQGATVTWGMGFPARIAALFPSHKVSTRWFSDGGNVYNTAGTALNPTGTRTINLWMGAVAGKDSAYPVARIDTLVRGTNADVVIFSHGHNESTTDSDRALRDRYVQHLETVRAELPSAAVVLMSQNPGSSATATMSGRRADLYRRIAAERGYGFIDARQAFIADGRDINTILVQGDGLHPTAEGHLVWLDEVMRHFLTADQAQAIPMQPPALYSQRRNLLLNGDFADTSAPSGFAINNWWATNCTVSQDTAIKESKAYSIKLTQTTGATSAKFWQTIPPGIMPGRDITVAVRLYIPSGTPTTAARVSVVDTVSALMSSSEFKPIYDKWHWKIVTTTVGLGSNGVTVNLFPDAVSTAEIEVMNIDRVVLCLGRYPSDI